IGWQTDRRVQHSASHRHAAYVSPTQILHGASQPHTAFPKKNHLSSSGHPSRPDPDPGRLRRFLRRGRAADERAGRHGAGSGGAVRSVAASGPGARSAGGRWQASVRAAGGGASTQGLVRQASGRAVAERARGRWSSVWASSSGLSSGCSESICRKLQREADILGRKEYTTTYRDYSTRLVFLLPVFISHSKYL
ncbi:unnamed protein product, partial [Urochloa humidicola]